MNSNHSLKLTNNKTIQPYDLYYIIKEKQETPNAPLDFYLNTKVRWWGKAFKRKIN